MATYNAGLVESGKRAGRWAVLLEEIAGAKEMHELCGKLTNAIRDDSEFVFPQVKAAAMNAVQQILEAMLPKPSTKQPEGTIHIQTAYTVMGDVGLSEPLAIFTSAKDMQEYVQRCPRNVVARYTENVVGTVSDQVG